MTYFSIFIVIVSLFSCQLRGADSKAILVEAAIENGSAHDLDWVEMEWDGPRFTAGILTKGVFKTDVRFRWPFVPTGKLTFVDDASRKKYSVDLSFAVINDKIRSKSCRAVTVRILDYDRVEIVCGYPRDSGR